jgi:PiT family inorganic phosphate transporter
MDLAPALFGGSALIGCVALVFSFSNGFRDSSTVVATVVSTRALSPNWAFALCGVAECAGALLLGSAVAMRVSHDMLSSSTTLSGSVLLTVLGAALAAAVIWGAVGWWRAWPVSNNQALFAGLLGASTVAYWPHPIHFGTFARVFSVLVVSPIIGFVASVFLTRALRFTGGWMTPRAKWLVDRLHVAFCLVVSCAQGANDSQLAMGVLILSAAAVKGLPLEALDAGVPLSIRIAAALSLSLGVLMGGRRILKQLGMRFYRIRPTQGLGAQMSSAAVIMTCAISGFPASTTQVITGSILGAGVAKNVRSIRWTVAEEIVLSWFITIPVVALLAAVLFWVFSGKGGAA